jgi:nicotinate-nucleotide adenylyltransferase
MAGLAFAGVAHAEVKACELERPGPTYTVDTLQAIHAKNPAAQLYLLIGWDQALALTTWHRWQDIVGLAIICIAPRTDSSASPSSHDAILAHIPAIRHLQLPLMPLSATQIRQEIALKHPINALVPDAVVRYIDQHHLYQSA